MVRLYGRSRESIRPVSITRHYILYPEGSVLIEFGNTKVLCNASVEESVPPFKKGSGEGWVTAEYAMLPRATAARTPRDISRLKQNARGVEIQRLIGRALRAAIDLKALGERTVTVDCDVLQADGGTRTASISGGFVALYDACARMVMQGKLARNPLVHPVAAVSVGIVGGEAMVDLCYEEDAAANVDMNVVMTGEGHFVEIQGTGEKAVFSDDQLAEMLRLAKIGIASVFKAQRQALGL